MAWTITGLVLNLLGAGLLAFVPLVVHAWAASGTDFYGRPTQQPSRVEGVAVPKYASWLGRRG